MNEKALKIFGGTMQVICTMFGVGMLTLPTAFLYTGVINGMIITLAIAFINLLTSMFLIYVASWEDIWSYPGLCKERRKSMEFFCDLITIANGFSATLVYFAYIHDYVMLIIGDIMGRSVQDDMKIRCLVGLFFAIVFIFLLLYMKTLDSLHFTSILAVISAFYLVVMLIWYKFFCRYLEGDHKTEFYRNYGDGRKYLSGTSFIIFSLGCQQNIISIYNELGEGTRSILIGWVISIVGFAIVAIVYIAIGSLGSILLGGNVANSQKFLQVVSDILKMSTQEQSSGEGGIETGVEGWLLRVKSIASAASLGILMFVMILISSFMFQIFSARESLFNQLRNASITLTTWLKVSINIAHVVIVGLAAVFNVDTSVIINIVGLTVSPLISFVLPSILLATSPYKKRPAISTTTAWIIALFFTALIPFGIFFEFKDNFYSIYNWIFNRDVVHHTNEEIELIHDQ